MTKKLLITSALIIASSAVLTGCSLLPKSSSNSTEQNSEITVNQADPGEATKETNSPETSPSQVPVISNSTEVSDLENDLGNLNLAPESFE